MSAPRAGSYAPGPGANWIKEILGVRGAGGGTMARDGNWIWIWIFGLLDNNKIQLIFWGDGWLKASRPLPGGPSGPPGTPLLFGKMAPATLEISIFSGNLLKIPPGAAFGGAPGALRAPGRGDFQQVSAEN